MRACTSTRTCSARPSSCLTGFHGAHVTVGVLILLSMLCSIVQRQRSRADDPLPVEIAGLYWHFVDIVWIIIFTLVYLVEPMRTGDR